MRSPTVPGVAIGCSLLLAACQSPCAECIDEKCADLVQYCDDKNDCTCMIDCMGDEGVPGVDGCLGTCGLSERPGGFAAIEECTAVACPDSEDECSTPGGWTPQVADLVCETTSPEIGGGTLADCGFDPGLAFRPEGDVLQLETADKGICVRIERRNDGRGDLANTKWTLLSLTVGPLGEVARVEGASEGCWYSSHHNFRDFVHAWTGSRHVDVVLKHDGHNGARTYALYVFEQGPIDTAQCPPTHDGETCLQGPIALQPVDP